MRAPFKLPTFYPLGKMDDGMRGVVEAVNADGQRFKRHLYVSRNFLRAGMQDLGPQMAYMVQKATREIMKEMERHEPPEEQMTGDVNLATLYNTIATSNVSQHVDWTRWLGHAYGSFSEANWAIASNQTAAPLKPAKILEPVPLSELVDNMEFCPIGRALEFLDPAPKSDAEPSLDLKNLYTRPGRVIGVNGTTA